MYTLLLMIIYLAFISLGLPDSLLGSAWPVMIITHLFDYFYCAYALYVRKNLSSD